MIYTEMKFHIGKTLLASVMLNPSLIISGCSATPEKYFHTSIDIGAPREDLWSILVDNKTYPEWNPYHVKVEGEMSVGSRLDVKILKPNGETVEIEPYVLRLQPQRELAWGGGIKGIFYCEHVFLLTALDESSTRLVQKEQFSGIAIPFASLDTIEEGYELMNEALKARAETRLKTAHED